MSESGPPIRNISDTARWVAYFRARETRRPDALFHDRYAERLAGERGFQIAHALSGRNRQEWAWAARTYLFDKFVLREIQNGADLIINLAAGLDSRPYRLGLPAALQWVEVDLPEIISYKEEILAPEEPKCRIDRIRLDLSDVPRRRVLLADLGRRATKITVMSEGLLLYFSPEEVGALASDLAAGNHIETWIVDLVSPGQLKLMQRTMGEHLIEAGAGFKFAPPEGPNFFKLYGWEPKEVQGYVKTAAQLNRLPPELHALLPEPQGLPGNFPWTGICLLKAL